MLLLLAVFFVAASALAWLVMTTYIKPVTPLARQLRFQEQVWRQAYGWEAAGSQSGSVLGRLQGLIVRLAEHRGFDEVVAARLAKAGIKLSAGTAILYHFVIVIAGSIFFLVLLKGILGALLGVSLGAILPVAVVSAMSGRRAAKLEKQLPEALTLIAGSLKAGYSLQQAMDMVSQEMKPPISDDFGQVITETRLGVSLDDGLVRLSERADSSTLAWMIMAIRIQHEVGGNLAEIFEVLASTIKEREQIYRQVQVLTAEGRLSAIILLVLPFLLGAALWMFNREYIVLLVTNPVGWAMLGVASVLMIIGGLWMKKVVTIEV